VKEQNDESKPTPVAATPKQAGAARDRWGWVERSVWTERMLTRLTEGEPANRVWFTLVDKTYAPANLARAFQKVLANNGCAGVDEQTVAHFERQGQAELARLNQQLREGTYRPQPLRRAWIAKPGSKEKRPLGIPACSVPRFSREVGGELPRGPRPAFCEMGRGVLRALLWERETGRNVSLRGFVKCLG